METNGFLGGEIKQYEWHMLICYQNRWMAFGSKQSYAGVASSSAQWQSEKWTQTDIQRIVALWLKTSRRKNYNGWTSTTEELCLTLRRAQDSVKDRWTSRSSWAEALAWRSWRHIQGKKTLTNTEITRSTLVTLNPWREFGVWEGASCCWFPAGISCPPQLSVTSWWEGLNKPWTPTVTEDELLKIHRAESRTSSLYIVYI